MTMTIADGITSEQAALVAAVAEFAESELAPHALEWDQTKHFPVDVLAKAENSAWARSMRAKSSAGRSCPASTLP